MGRDLGGEDIIVHDAGLAPVELANDALALDNCFELDDEVADGQMGSHALSSMTGTVNVLALFEDYHADALEEMLSRMALP